MDLRQFPFDAQNLSVEFCSFYWNSSFIQFVVPRTGHPSSDLASAVFLDPGVAAQSFPSFKFTGVTFEHGDRAYSYLEHYDSDNGLYGHVSMRIRCERDPTYVADEVTLSASGTVNHLALALC